LRDDGDILPVGKVREGHALISGGAVAEDHKTADPRSKHLLISGIGVGGRVRKSLGLRNNSGAE
jgi:hypothetical protein